MQACATIETPFMGIACQFTLCMDEEKKGEPANDKET